MKRIFSSAIIVLILAFALPAQNAQTAPDAAELTRLLNEFLAGASRSDAAIHERFWAEDLIYTGSAGRRIAKVDIMRDLKPAPAPKPPVKPDDPKTTYSAEDVRIQQYGSTAIVAFRLVATTVDDGATQMAKFFNTGTFLKRKGKWQAVSWQATRIPRPEEDSKREVTAAQAAFHQALLTADVKTLKTLTDESFIWTHDDGMQASRALLLDVIGSGKLKYSSMETDKVTVSVTGDTAIVRGVSSRRRSAIPSGGSDAAPFTSFYTMTFVNRGGAWKAVALHTSRSTN